MSKITTYLLLGVLTISVLGFLIFGASRALAAGVGDADDVNLHIKVEVSADHGATWYNFSGTEDAEGDVVTVTPGEELEFRVKVWNSGTINANNIDITGTVSNSDYVTALVITESDFVGFAFTDGGAGTAGILNDGSTEDAGFASVTGTITISDTFPVGQTIISGNVNIDDYLPGEFAMSPIRKIASLFDVSNAKAVGVDRFSRLRIAVNVADPDAVADDAVAQAEETTTTTTTTSETEAAEATDLPDTGGSLINDINKYFDLR